MASSVADLTLEHTLRHRTITELGSVLVRCILQPTIQLTIHVVLCVWHHRLVTVKVASHLQ